MTSARDADVAVVGAGPAGAWSAYRLACAGARVVVFDHSHPREKPCGGGLTRRALAIVAGAVSPDDLAGRPIPTATFVDPCTSPAAVSLVDASDRAARLIVVDRRRFDAALLGAAVGAGAEHVAERVRDVEVSGSGAVLRTDRHAWRAAFVVGADGANSVVRRRLSRPFTRAQLSIAAGAFAHETTAPDIVIEFVADPQGYIWSFPRPDHLAIGICAQADESDSATLRARVDAWTARYAPARGARLVRYGWPIPSLSAADWEPEQPAGTRWALAGDAAGLVDPITREGIFFALRSADLLAAALIAGADAHERYLAELRREIVPELQRAARLKRGFFRGGFTRLLVDALRHSSSVARIMGDLVAGEQPYATLKRRLLATFEVRLAWQLLMLEFGRAARPATVIAGGTPGVYGPTK